jgi:pilus assembly protein Flp/PilA
VGKQFLRAIARDERGASLVEYSVLIGLVAAATIGLVSTAGGKTLSAWSSLNSSWRQASSAGAGIGPNHAGGSPGQSGAAPGHSGVSPANGGRNQGNAGGRSIGGDCQVIGDGSLMCSAASQKFEPQS